MENFPRPVRCIDPACLEDNQAFLISVAPFQSLPPGEIDAVAAHLAKQPHVEGDVLFRQEETRLPHILIVRTGRLERIIEENGRPAVKETLGPGRIYGGISLLFNNGISTSTVRSIESGGAYCLEREHFLRLCIQHRAFADFFAGSMDEGKKTTRDAKPAAVSPGAGPRGSDLWAAAGDLTRAFPSCRAGTPIREAAELLTASGRGAIVVQDDPTRPIGIITDDDLRKKVIVEGRSAEEPARAIMSAPLISIDARAPAFDGVLSMMRHRIKHLPVFENGRIQGLLTERDLFLARTHSPVFLIHEIQNSQEIKDLKDAYEKMPAMVAGLIANGARADYLNGVVTAITDAVLDRIMTDSLAALGPPPTDFAFLLFGSEGRKEQTLKTDQDNAIVYKDLPEKAAAGARDYFLELGRRVCDRLDEAGQKHCDFNIMAKNPEWCQPLSRWKTYYRKWIVSDDPDHILNANIFFDFRLGHGDQGLVDSLHAGLFEELSEWPGLLRHMARNTLSYRPPLGFFGNFLVKERGEGKRGLNIKSAMRLVVDFGRIYAMQSEMIETNTIRRLEALYTQNRLKKEERDDLVHAYDFLMHQRLKRQSRVIEKNGKAPDNVIHPADLTTIDQQALKEAFKQIRIAQAKMRLDFLLYFP